MRLLRDLSIEAGHYPESLKEKVDKLDKAVYQYRLNILSDHLENKEDIEDKIETMVSGGDRDG
jgi:Na+/phosphate symporter